MKATQSSNSATEEREKRLQMESYLPYQLALLSSRLSLSLEKICKRDFSISRTEWRVLALVGQVESCAASELVERSVMDAVAVHRAVKRLETIGLLARSESADDLRVRPLRLTAQGRKVYQTVIPYAVDLQAQLLGRLPAPLRKPFKEALQLLTKGDASFEL